MEGILRTSAAICELGLEIWMKVGVNFWRGSGCPICDRLFFSFFFCFVTKLSRAPCGPGRGQECIKLKDLVQYYVI
jgi:hypothetical protein